MDEKGYVEGNVFVSLSEIINRDLDGFLDRLGERLVDNECLMDISYKPVGVVDGKIVIRVRGDVSEVIAMNEE